MRHVILGNGHAGVVAAETLRQHAPHDEIVLIGGEAGPVYSRTALPSLLAGETDERGCWLRSPGHFPALRIAQKTAQAVHLDCRTNTLRFRDGTSLAFDRLLIATGASPRPPAMAGSDHAAVFSCSSLAEVHRILPLLRPGARAVLIGGGFIGCRLMEALVARGVCVTVVEAADRLLPAVLGSGAGRMVARWCAAKGVQLCLNTRALAISRNRSGSARYSVRLPDNVQLPADLIVHATGVQPNIGFLHGSGIRWRHGVVVDATMRTNADNVWAAGDCAEVFDAEAGHNVIAGIASNAADQAYCAALNMAGEQAFQCGVRHVDVFETMGLLSASFGRWQGVHGGEWVEAADARRFRYLRLEFSQDVLIGCNLVGTLEHAGTLRALIRRRVRLGQWKIRLLRDPGLIRQAWDACMAQQVIDHASLFHTPKGRLPEHPRHVA